MGNEELVAQIKAMGSYRDVRVLEDGTIIGIGSLIFTTAIYMDMDMCGYGRRFCFKDDDLAEKQYRLLTSGDDEPEGYIARR